MTETECPMFDDSLGAVPRQFKSPLFADDRGYFSEAWNRKNAYVPNNIAQINHSYSEQGTIRGMHWQKSPYAVGKYVTCLRGFIEDVVVDIRQQSKTFGQWQAHYLMGAPHLEARHSLWVPPGFAHGFSVVSSSADVIYLQDGLYNPEAERCFRYDDPDIGIRWMLVDDKPTRRALSKKDAHAPSFMDLKDDELF